MEEHVTGGLQLLHIL